jgi:predicted CopG family antitoxin
MTKTIRVSENVHEVVKAHNRDDETMEETLRRLTGGPSPEALAEIIGSDGETATEMRKAIERNRERGRERRAELRDRFE